MLFLLCQLVEARACVTSYLHSYLMVWTVIYIFHHTYFYISIHIKFFSGITLVVTPLVSLMEDQLGALQRLGIEAAKLNASSSKEEVNQVHAVIASH